MGSFIWSGLDYLNLVTGERVGGFVPNVTEPYYEISPTFAGRRNVGVSPGVTLTPYTGSVVGGVAQLQDGALYENVLFNCVLDIRSNVTLRNCRVVVPSSYTTTADSIKACVRVLNGAATANVLLENVEIHNRAQRPMNGITGRNFTMRRSVITGCIDGWSDSAGGSAPQNYGYVVEDCMVPAIAWWYSSTINSDIHSSDQGSHSDVFQKTTALQGTVRNCVLLAYVDELIGTGTPGCGNDAGNPYVPPGFNYLATQAQAEAWRSQFTVWTEPSQTKYGVSRRLVSAGSLAVVMVNAGALDLDRCHMGGGTVQVNAAGTSLPSVIDMRLTDNIHWNDMVNGHTRTVNGQVVYDPEQKGHAVLTRTGKSFEAFTGNKWFDDSDVSIVRF